MNCSPSHFPLYFLNSGTIMKSIWNYYKVNYRCTCSYMIAPIYAWSCTVTQSTRRSSENHKKCWKWMRTGLTTKHTEKVWDCMKIRLQPMPRHFRTQSTTAGPKRDFQQIFSEFHGCIEIVLRQNLAIQNANLYWN